VRRLLYADSEVIPDKAAKSSHAVIQLPGTFDELRKAVEE